MVTDFEIGRPVLTVDCGRSGPYLEALRSVGADSKLIDAADYSPDSADTLLEGAGGLMLMGGSDVNPALYGEDRHPMTEAPDDPRDSLESALIAVALRRDLPIFAICRGMQILNVQQGGTLIQHLEPPERHAVRGLDRTRPVHQVEIEPGSLLGRIGGGAPMEVNSRHHQAVGRVGDGLVVTGRDPATGVIEAVERPDRGFCVAVQWHPEDQVLSDPRQLALFQAFREAVATRARGL